MHDFGSGTDAILLLISLLFHVGGDLLKKLGPSFQIVSGLKFGTIVSR